MINVRRLLIAFSIAAYPMWCTQSAHQHVRFMQFDNYHTFWYNLSGLDRASESDKTDFTLIKPK